MLTQVCNNASAETTAMKRQSSIKTAFLMAIVSSLCNAALASEPAPAAQKQE
jgi:hypothetical protein